jgi:RNA 3'-terminal phosphate cyclase (ATP)
LETRGELRGRRARAIVANLPRAIAERELSTLVKELEWESSAFTIEERTDSIGPGNVVIAEVESEHLTEVFTAFGEKQVRAEAVANSVAAEVRAYLATDAPVGQHLGDQLILLLALAGQGTFRTVPPTKHAHTQLHVINRFLGPVVAGAEEAAGTWRFTAKR